jgi:hypothetical protein
MIRLHNASSTDLILSYTAQPLRIDGSVKHAHKIQYKTNLLFEAVKIVSIGEWELTMLTRSDLCIFHLQKSLF